MALWQIPVELKGISKVDLLSFQTEVEKVLGGNNSTVSTSLHFGKFDGNDISVYFLENNWIKIRLRIVPDEDLIDEISAIARLVSKFHLVGCNEKWVQLLDVKDWELLIKSSNARAFILNPQQFFKQNF